MFWNEQKRINAILKENLEYTEKFNYKNTSIVLAIYKSVK